MYKNSTSEMTTMDEEMDSNVSLTLDSDWIDEFLEDDQEDITNLLEFDDQSAVDIDIEYTTCLLYTSPSPRDKRQSRMPSSA